MPIQLMNRYSRADIQANPGKLFVFGDNAARRGHGGQAREARGEPNAIGIRTKKAPTYEEADFFTDAEYPLNVTAILEDFYPVFRALCDGETVVWPTDGVGTGIAQLATRAPHTLAFISSVIAALKDVYGVSESSSQPHPERTSP